MEILKVLPNGQPHGLIRTQINNQTKAEALKYIDKSQWEKIAKKTERDKKPTKVRYIHFKNTLSGTRWIDYSPGPGEPIYVYKFVTGNSYTVPRGLIDAVNHPIGRINKREGALDDAGRPLQEDSPYSYRIDELIPDGFPE